MIRWKIDSQPRQFHGKQEANRKEMMGDKPFHNFVDKRLDCQDANR